MLSYDGAARRSGSFVGDRIPVPLHGAARLRQAQGLFEGSSHEAPGPALQPPALRAAILGQANLLVLRDARSTSGLGDRGVEAADLVDEFEPHGVVAHPDAALSAALGFVPRQLAG